MNHPWTNGRFSFFSLSRIPSQPKPTTSRIATFAEASGLPRRRAVCRRLLKNFAAFPPQHHLAFRHPLGPVVPSHSPPSRRFSPSITRVKAISQLVLRPASPTPSLFSYSPMYFSKERFSLAKLLQRAAPASRKAKAAGGADRRTKPSRQTSM